MSVFRYRHLLKFQPSRLGRSMVVLETYRDCNEPPNGLRYRRGEFVRLLDDYGTNQST